MPRNSQTNRAKVPVKDRPAVPVPRSLCRLPSPAWWPSSIPRVLSCALASPTGIFLAHVLDALEARRKVLDLPTLLRSDLLSLHAVASAHSLLRAQFTDLGGHRKISKLAGARRPECRCTLHSSKDEIHNRSLAVPKRYRQNVPFLTEAFQAQCLEM